MMHALSRHHGKLIRRAAALLTVALMAATAALAQDDDADGDIWRQVQLQGLDYKKAKNHCVRLYAYYRYTDDGVAFFGDRKDQLYRVYEGICSLDIRYSRDEDDGADVICGRNLVHPDQQGHFMDFYELKPYTFLEKARREPKRYTIETQGDTTRVYTRLGLAGTAVRDTVARQLRIRYNALSPDTAQSINLLILKGHLSHVDADAVYDMDDASIDYVPQGNLRRMVFDGDIVIAATVGVNMSIDRRGETVSGVRLREEFHEHTEIYVDSVVYMTRDEYRADRKLTAAERRRRSGYADADIDRLRRKLGVPPLSDAQRKRIEDQRDWDDMMEQWSRTKDMIDNQQKK